MAIEWYDDALCEWRLVEFADSAVFTDRVSECCLNVGVGMVHRASFHVVASDMHWIQGLSMAHHSP